MIWPDSPIVLLGHFQSLRNWSIRRHAHEGIRELVVVVNGAVEVTLDGERIVAEAGELLNYAPGTPHRERSVGPAAMEIYWLAWFERRTDAPLMSLPPLLRDRAGRVRMLVQWLHEWKGIPAQEPIWHAPFLAVRQALVELANPPEERLVNRVRSFVSDHLRERISLDDLSAMAGMSRFHFAREFCRTSGMPPMQFVRAARVEAAKPLLLHSDMPLRTIAPTVGFADEGQFARAFRTMTGMSPGRFRIRVRSGVVVQQPGKIARPRPTASSAHSG